MATAAFRSTSRRTSIGGDSSTSKPRRSRSVSRFSHRLPDEEDPPSAVRRGKFVNTMRGSEFPEISLDDLAVEMFSLSDVSSSANTDCRRGRELVSDAETGNGTGSCRRGRSVSRRERERPLSGTELSNNKNGSVRRRRSLSVVPKTYSLVSDSENDHVQKNRNRVDSTHQKHIQKPTITSLNQQRGLRRCNSQKDLSRSYDGYMSYSSTLTDDEGNDARFVGRGIEKGIRAASTLDKEPHTSSRNRNNMLYTTTQKESTHPGRDNRLDVHNNDNKLPGLVNSDGRRSADSDALKAVSTIRRNYKTKLEESERRKEELLAEILLEEERGKELKKIVGDLLPNGKESSPIKRPMRGRKRSTDRTRVSKKLVEDADKIIEDFISSVEETDISSFDGERSDTSSIVGGAVKPMMLYGEVESFRSPLRPDLQSGEMDGVVLPWLKWETGDVGTPVPGNDVKQHPATPKTVLQDALEETTGRTEQDQSVDSKSSRGSWSPGIANSLCLDIGETSRTGEVESCKNQLLSRVPRKSRVDIDDYLKPPSNESTLSEIWKQRDTIHSGGLLICNGGSFGKFLM